MSQSVNTTKFTPAKAIAAAIVTGLGVVWTVIQTALLDDEVNPEEVGGIVAAVLVFIATVAAVYQVRNKPIPEQPVATPLPATPPPGPVPSG